jgi:ParB family chromosome partitioning protein
MQEGSSSAQKIHVDDIAPNPRNPEARSVRIDDLVPSVSKRGVLVPILVTPVGEWLAQHPEDAEAVAGKQWVAQDGHRRMAAARRAERPEVPYQLRGVEVDESLIRLHTSKAMRLTPIEEAQQYRRLIDQEQMTQQAIAAETGVSQSHVAKRLKLLTLPESIQEAVDYGRVEVGEALKLSATKDRDLVDRVGEAVADILSRIPDAAAPGPDVDDDDEDEPPAVVTVDLAATLRRVTEAQQLAAGKEVAKERAEELGAEYCEDIETRLGHSAYSHRVYQKTDVAKAAAAKNLLVVPTRSEPAYYVIHRERPAHVDQQKVEARNRRLATEARGKALRIAATAKVSAAVLQEALVTMALTGLALGSNTTALAYDLARDAELAPDGMGDWTWRKALSNIPAAQRAKHAWIIALAAFETHTRPDHLSWGPTHAYYFTLLHQVAGYSPTEWEQARLDAITTTEED